MDILDFSFDPKQDYSIGNDLNMRDLMDLSLKTGPKPPLTPEKVAMLEKEIWASRYVGIARDFFVQGNPNWFKGYFKYFGYSILLLIYSDSADCFLDQLWELRFRKILPVRQIPKLGGLLLRLLVPAAALLFFAAAAGVFLVPDLLPDIREHSAGVLTVVLGMILVPVSLIFSFVGLIFAVGILGVLSEQIGTWLEKQGPWLQNWLAPMAVALVLVIVGILLLLWSKKLRAKPLPKRKLPLSEAKRAMVKRKIEEAEKFLNDCKQEIVLTILTFNVLSDQLTKAFNKMHKEGAAPETIEKHQTELEVVLSVGRYITDIAEKYAGYEERLKKLKAEL